MKAGIQFHQHVATPALLSAIMFASYEHSNLYAAPRMDVFIQLHDAALDAPSTNDRLAKNCVQKQIDEHWIKVAGVWTTKFQLKNARGDVIPGEPDVLYRQLRHLDFTLEPKTLSKEAKDAGVQYVASVRFAKTSERSYRTVGEHPRTKDWTAWQDAALGAFATVERRHGTWSIHGTDLFTGVTPNPSIVPPGK